jgi:cytochrome c
MELSSSRRILKLATFAVLQGLLAPQAWALDTDAAERMTQDNKCTKCHAVDRKKDAPAYRDIAAKYKSEADAEAKLTHHVTAGDAVKFADGHQEKHKKAKGSPEEIKNLVDWIRSLPGGTKY